MSAYSLLMEEVMRELDDRVCTKHPPDWDVETVACNVICLAEQYMEWR